MVGLPLVVEFVPAACGGAARVVFGGMRFLGLLDGLLVFARTERRMTLEPEMVSTVWVDGQRAWPKTSPKNSIGS